jgi:hypothetical protein
MKAKLHASGFGATLGALAALALVACGQGADSTPESSSDTSDALNTVITCQQQAFACGQDAGPSGLAACQTGLQACLMSLFPGTGTPPGLPSFDAGTPPRLPDAGLPRLPTPPTTTPPRFDAGAPTPPMLPDAGVPADAQCLASLQACLLGGTTMPTTCASDAQTCLTAAMKARCDAQEAACTASGAPAQLCQAARAACH